MTLQEKFTQVVARVKEELLPGWEELIDTNDKIAPYLEKCKSKCFRAIEDEDPVLLDRALKDYAKGLRRINEILARDYMEKNPDPTTWELRYLKWVKPGYIKFSSERGDFYIIMGKPDSRAPTDAPCFTVDEALVMLHPVTAQVINTFNALPVSAAGFKRPVPELGESVDHIYVEADNVTIRTELGKPKKKYGR